uniref:SCP2 domain-containing protein n=1 Tax=Tetradesmus obliquus TaxID=3088 RepID=A0A383W0W3_TETOB
MQSRGSRVLSSCKRRHGLSSCLLSAGGIIVDTAHIVKLVMGKLNPQQAFLLRKLKINGSMGLALKLQPILDAAAPRAKL